MERRRVQVKSSGFIIIATMCTVKENKNSATPDSRKVQQ